MTFQVNGDDIMAAIHIARIVGTVVTTVLLVVLIAWAVRPSKRVRDRMERREELARDPADDEELWDAVERMEARMEVLERAMADQLDPQLPRRPRRDGILAPAEEGRDSGRTE